MTQHPDPDKVDDARFGLTATPCDKCPAIAHLKDIMVKANKLALLVDMAVTDTIPAEMETTFDTQCRELARKILESK